MLRSVIIFSVVSICIYLCIAAALITTGKLSEIKQTKDNLHFNELFFDYTGLPELKHYKARDGATLDYRYYGSKSDTVLILLHGSGYQSRYFFPLAEYISSKGLAHVYTPDLRGHGISPERRGDIDYIGQFEDDIADLAAVVRRHHPKSRLIVGGHSSGGGLALRFAGSDYGPSCDGFILLSPFLKYNAPTMQPQSGGWAQVNIRRIIGLSMLNNIGIRWFNHLTVIHFNMPEDARDGTETLSYTHRLNTGFAPENYSRDLKAIKKPLLVVVGKDDEVFQAAQFEPVITQYVSAQVELLDGVSHMGVVVGPEIRPVIGKWFESLK